MNVWAIPHRHGDKNGQKDHSKTPEYELGLVIIKCADTNIVTLRKFTFTYCTRSALQASTNLCHFACENDHDAYVLSLLNHGRPMGLIVLDMHLRLDMLCNRPLAFQSLPAFQSLLVLRPPLILRESPALHPSLR